MCYLVLVDVEEVYLENKVNKEENTRWARAAFSSPPYSNSINQVNQKDSTEYLFEKSGPSPGFEPETLQSLTLDF